MINLSAAGLNETEAKVYSALLEEPEWQPAELAKIVNESRTNMYKILDNLVSMNLAKKYDKAKKIHYKATNPYHLLQLAHEARLKQDQAQRELELNVHSLLREYIKTSDLPGVRYFQGVDELKNIYNDQIKSGEEIYIIRPDYNMDIYNFDYMTSIRHMARKAKIKRHAITPDRKKAPKNYKESDPYMLLNRTWIEAGEYSAPVEWNAYGNKLAIISFGNEATGTIIESPQIAESFKQIYRLMEKNLRKNPNYKLLPKHAEYTGSTKDGN